jgi:anaerobic selenocysteine-containing dehydrogenase
MHEKKEDKKVQIVKMGAWSGGPGCHGGCGVEVYIKDGRVIKVEGDPDHPFCREEPVREFWPRLN